MPKKAVTGTINAYFYHDWRRVVNSQHMGVPSNKVTFGFSAALRHSEVTQITWFGRWRIWIVSFGPLDLYISIVPSRLKHGKKMRRPANKEDERRWSWHIILCLPATRPSGRRSQRDHPPFSYVTNQGEAGGDLGLLRMSRVTLNWGHVSATCR